MKQWKKALSCVLALAMLVCLLPVAALAADSGVGIPEFGVGLNTLEPGTYYVVGADGKTLSKADENDFNIYSARGEDGMLRVTLKDAQLKSALYVPGNTTVVLEGTNSIESGTGIQSQSAGTVRLEGSGSLELTTSTEGLLIKDGDCVIQDITLVIHNGAYAVNVSGKLCIDGASVTTTGTQPSLYSEKSDIEISGNAVITAAGGIDAEGKVTVKDTAKVEVTASNIAINADDCVEILDDAYVKATGSTGINSFSGSVIIDGEADVTGTGSSQAAISVGLSYIAEEHTIRIGGTLRVTGDVGVGLMYGDIEIDGGVVTAEKCGLIGLYVMQSGDVSITDATVTVSGTHGIRTNGGTITVADSIVTVTANGGRPFLTSPVLNYKDGADVFAGEDAETAPLIAESKRVESTYTDNAYVRIQPHTASEGDSPILPILGSLLPTLGSQVQSPFVDVTPVDYYYDAVNWAVDNGITTGTGRYSFSPDEACTRAQAVTLLWRAAGSPAPKSAATPFVDVDSNAYYYKAVLWAVENGITNGTSDTTFSPSETCTRAQIVTFLYRAFGKQVTSSASFADVAADAYYAPAVAWAAANSITGGTGSGKFSPAATCTRAQIVTFLYRCCG